MDHNKNISLIIVFKENIKKEVIFGDSNDFRVGCVDKSEDMGRKDTLIERLTVSRSINLMQPKT